MTWPPEQLKRPPDVSWTLQVQQESGGWWSNHTSGLFPREAADALLADRRAAYPQLRYRLVRLTTTYTVERARLTDAAP